MPEEYNFNRALQEIIDNHVEPGDKYIFEIQRDKYNLLVKTYVEMLAINQGYLIILNLFLIVLFITTVFFTI